MWDKESEMARIEAEKEIVRMIVAGVVICCLGICMTLVLLR